MTNFEFGWAGDAGPAVRITGTMIMGLLPIGDEDDIGFADALADEWERWKNEHASPITESQYNKAGNQRRRHSTMGPKTDQSDQEQDQLEDEANTARWYGYDDLANEAMRQLDEKPDSDE